MCPCSRVLETETTTKPCNGKRVIAVVQLINKQGKLLDGGGRDSFTGMHFTSQDEAVIGAFLSLLGPHIFKSSMLQPKRKMNIRVRRNFFECTCLYVRTRRNSANERVVKYLFSQIYICFECANSGCPVGEETAFWVVVSKTTVNS